MIDRRTFHNLADFMAVEDKIKELADKYVIALRQKIDARVIEMQQDDVSHFLIYRVLGVSHEEGSLIDVYQNKGRLLYKDAGSFLEAATKLCFKSAFPDSGSIKLPNTIGTKPKYFEVDCLVGNNALEIKWRDATTDGDHIIKEHNRLQVTHNAGYVPIRVMFYYPNREKAIKIQRTLETVYKGLNGSYHHGDKAWSYVKERTGVDLRQILEKLAAERKTE